MNGEPFFVILLSDVLVNIASLDIIAVHCLVGWDEDKFKPFADARNAVVDVIRKVRQARATHKTALIDASVMDQAVLVACGDAVSRNLVEYEIYRLLRPKVIDRVAIHVASIALGLCCIQRLAVCAYVIVAIV